VLTRNVLTGRTLDISRHKFSEQRAASQKHDADNR
jgi:hypothetical protein